MYEGEFSDRFPLFGADSQDYTQPFWYQILAPYVAKRAQAAGTFNTDPLFYDTLRRCPGGSYGPAPYSGDTPAQTNWNCYIGCYFASRGQQTTTPSYSGIGGPFYYGDAVPAMPSSKIKHPAQAMIFVDTITHYLYSPLLYPFSDDNDQDGIKDTWPNYGVAYNWARPTVHSGGAN